MPADVRPSGKYLMEDFYYAGGLPALLTRIAHRLDLSQRNVAGKTLGETLEGRGTTTISSARWTTPSPPPRGLPCCTAICAGRVCDEAFCRRPRGQQH